MLLSALESAETTQIPQRILLTGLMILILAWAIFSIRRSWQKKIKQQNEIPRPSSVPADFVADESFEGRYLASTHANDWLSRIVVHGLGAPSRVVLSVAKIGIRISFNSGKEIFIPMNSISQIHADRAMAGRAFEKDGIAVIVWRLGEIEIASGFRADTSEAHTRFLQITSSKQESGK